MLNIEINQDVNKLVNLMGKQVSFVSNIKIQDQFHSFNVQGLVTSVVLDLDMNNLISVNNSDYYSLQDIQQFTLLD